MSAIISANTGRVDNCKVGGYVSRGVIGFLDASAYVPSLSTMDPFRMST